jgi:hypothetical protein
MLCVLDVLKLLSGSLNEGEGWVIVWGEAVL